MNTPLTNQQNYTILNTMVSQKVKVFIADDHAMILSGIKMSIETLEGFTVAGIATDGESAVRGILDLRPDIAILDLSIPLLNGFEILKKLRQESCSVKVIFLTSYTDNRYIKRALSIGVDGYVLKEDTSTELITALENVAKGFKYMSPRVMTKIVTDLETFDVKADAPSALDNLSGRELDVFRLIAQGKRGREICKELNIAEPTLKTHKHNLMKKLNLTLTQEIMLYAVKNHLFDSAIS